MAQRDIEWLAKAAIECGFQVHDDIGPGLLETAYEAFLAARLAERGLRVEAQSPRLPYTIRSMFRSSPAKEQNQFRSYLPIYITK